MHNSITSPPMVITPRSSHPERPKLLFMGPRSGGKSSIREVVFHKLQPDQTLHLETTRKITQDDIQSFINFEIWDLPGPLDADVLTMPFVHVGAVIFVIDAQVCHFFSFLSYANDLFQTSCDFTQFSSSSLVTLVPFHNWLQRSFKHTKQTQPYTLKFLCTKSTQSHLITGAASETDSTHSGDVEIIEQVKDRLTDELSDRELSVFGVPDLAVELSNRIAFKLTTVFDYSIYDALSRVIMKIVPQQAALEQLMNFIVQQGGVDNCILFDTWTKLYIATDSSPTEKPLLEMCSEFMDIFTDLSELYGVPHQISPVTRPTSMASGPGTGRAGVFGKHKSDSYRNQRSVSRGRSPEPSSATRSGATASGSSSLAVRGKSQKPKILTRRRMITSQVKVDSNFGGPRGVSAMGQQSIPATEQPGRVISYFEINQYLTLVCISHEEVMRTQGTLIEYNVARARESIEKIFQITNGYPTKNRRRVS